MMLSAFDFIRGKYNRLDILVNNAGIIRTICCRNGAFRWDKVIDTNLRAFLCTKYAAEMMMATQAR
jgi:3-oxoacyl-[acyl-carrier protein] reductase